MRRGRADSTWSAYERQWARFETWCLAAEDALPADPLTVARFLADLEPAWRPATPADPPELMGAGQVRERDGLRPGSLADTWRRSRWSTRPRGHPNPTTAEAVRRTMAGIRRHPGIEPATRWVAARRDDIAAILAAIRPEKRLGDARDAALVLIGCKGALRADDLSEGASKTNASPTKARPGDCICATPKLTRRVRAPRSASPAARHGQTP
jgi:hypothetical protein